MHVTQAIKLSKFVAMRYRFCMGNSIGKQSPNKPGPGF